MSTLGQRSGFKPILSQDMEDELMGMRNLNASATSFDPAELYEATPKAYPANRDPSSGYTQVLDRMSNEKGFEGFTSYKHGLNADSDKASNERYQELSVRRDELQRKIIDLQAEIDWQKKLKAKEIAKDPIWEAAKHDWIYKGDRSGLENITNRMNAEEQRRWQSKENEANRNAARESQAADKKQANIEILDRRKKILNRVMSEYARQDTAEARNAIFEAALDYAEYADKVGEDKNELFNKLLKQYEGQTNNPLRELFGMNTAKAPTAAPIGSSGEMVGTDSPAPAPAPASPNIKSESDLETELQSATSLAEMDEIANRAINDKVVIGDKANEIKQRILGEKRKEADVKLDAAKTSRDLEALVKEYEGILDPVRKTTLDTKIKSMRDAEVKAAEAKRKWLEKQNSIVNSMKGMKGVEAAEWIEDHKGYDEYVEVLNGVVTKKDYKAR